MSRGADEVQASVYAKVDLVIPARLLLLKHVGLVLVVEEFDDGHPRISVVDIVAETRGVDDGQANCALSIDGHHHLGVCLLVLCHVPLKNFSSSSALVISISTVLSTCFWWRLL